MPCFSYFLQALFNIFINIMHNIISNLEMRLYDLAAQSLFLFLLVLFSYPIVSHFLLFQKLFRFTKIWRERDGDILENGFIKFL